MRTPHHSEQSTDASLMLDLIRAGAAQVVCVGHAVSLAKVAGLTPPHVPYFQNIAVCVFFLLSGYLIGATLLQRATDPTYGFASYVIDRFARIYSGWVPALIVVAIIDGTLLAWHLHGHPKYVSLATWVGNLAMLQMYRGPLAFFAVPNFGSGGPFWTLGLEFHIYLFVGALFFAIKRQNATLAVIAAGLAWMPMRYLVGDVQAGLGTGLFGLWLVGFAIAAVLSKPAPAWASALLLAGGIAWTAISVTPGQEYAWKVYAGIVASLLGCLMLAMRSSLIRNSRWLPPIIRFTAAYSFTLYLLHYTVLYAIFQVWPHGGASAAVAGIVISNILAVAVAIPTEMRHRQLAAWLARVVPTTRRQGRGASALTPSRTR